MINLLLFNYELFRSTVVLGIVNFIFLIVFFAFDRIGGVLLDLWIGDK